MSAENNTDSITVELSYLEEVMRYLARIETTALENITWMRNGSVVKVSPESVYEWKFYGMNNRDFAMMRLDKTESASEKT